MYRRSEPSILPYFTLRCGAQSTPKEKKRRHSLFAISVDLHALRIRRHWDTCLAGKSALKLLMWAHVQPDIFMGTTTCPRKISGSFLVRVLPHCPIIRCHVSKHDAASHASNYPFIGYIQTPKIIKELEIIWIIFKKRLYWGI